MSLANDLTVLKERIELRTTKKIKLEGQLEEGMRILSEEFECNSYKKGEELVSNWKQKINDLEDKIEDGILKLDNLLNES